MTYIHTFISYNIIVQLIIVSALINSEKRSIAPAKGYKARINKKLNSTLKIVITLELYDLQTDGTKRPAKECRREKKNA